MSRMVASLSERRLGNRGVRAESPPGARPPIRPQGWVVDPYNHRLVRVQLSPRGKNLLRMLTLAIDAQT